MSPPRLPPAPADARLRGSGGRYDGAGTVALLARRWWLLVAGLLAGTVAGGWAAAAAPPVVVAEARFVLGPAPGLEQADLVDSASALERRTIIATFADVVASDRILREAARDAGVDPAGLSARSSVSEDANIVTLSVRGTDARTLERVAVIMGERAAVFFEDLYRVWDVDSLEGSGPTVRTVERSVPTGAVVGGVAGLIGAAVIAVVVDWMAAEVARVREAG